MTIYLFRNGFYRSHVMIFSINTFSDICVVYKSIVNNYRLVLDSRRMGLITEHNYAQPQFSG